MKNLTKTPKFIVLTSVIVVFTVGFFQSCKKEKKTQLSETSNSNNQFINAVVTSVGAEDAMEFAPQTSNPYTIANMQAALNSLVLNNEFECDYTKFNIRVTHKYIKFKPADSSQLEILLDDTSLLLFDYPLDRRRTKGGTYYRDPLTIEGSPNSQWTCIPSNKTLSTDVPYDVLAELYLPELDPQLTEYYNTSFDGCINLLIDEAMKRTNNFDTTWSDSAITKSPTEKISLSRPPKWTPAGIIRRFDNRTNSNVGLEGAKVRAHRWFEIREAITNVNGSYNMGSEFRYPVDYSIKWERNDFDIRSGTFGQAYFNGPNQKGNWNLDINSGKSRQFAHIHKAAVDYYYRASSFGVTAPPSNGFWNPRLHIAAHDKDKTSANATAHPWTRPFSAFPVLDFWNPNRRSDFIYGTAVHEIAHYAHWGFNKNGFNTGEDRAAESWADGVEWVLCASIYGSYGDAGDAAMTTGGTDSYQERVRAGTIFNNNSSFFSTYTPLVVDLIDNENQRNTRGHAGSTDFPIDNINGYTLSQIETSFKKSKTFAEWRTNLFNDHNNSTENNLQELFNNW